MKVTISNYAWMSKADMTPSQMEALRKILTLHPRKVGDHPGEAPGPIPLFSEDSVRFGVPRQFFMARRKPAHEVVFETTEGDKSDWPGDMTFAGTLRPEQARGKFEVVSNFKAGSLGGIVQAVPGWGKCVSAGTPVLKFDGTIVPVDSLKPGDLLMGMDSTPRTVLSTNRGHGPRYKITPIRGEPWYCNDVHILSLVNYKTNEIEDIDLQTYLQLTRSKKHQLKQFSPPTGIDFKPAEALPLDPYFLGVWYGDGTKNLNGVGVTKPDSEIAELCHSIAAQFNLQVRTSLSTGPNPCATHHIHGGVPGKPNPLLNLLRELYLDGDRLPRSYLVSSQADRLSFLAGLLDSDGYHNNGCYEIAQKRKEWADDICFLARSLGIRAISKEKIVNGESYWRVKLAGDFSVLPMRISRKLPRKRRQIKTATRTGFSVERAGDGEYVGIVIDGDRRFLLGDFTVTHNTVHACSVIAELQVPTLIVVHKEFLVDQWKQRLAQYIPGVQIGHVQGDICDFKGKHVVVGMIHSLVERDYGSSFYNHFGLVCTDEVHRIGSETWSRVPPKFNAKWRYALSATPRRKDGCEDVFRMHIGDVIFKSTEVRMKPKIKRVWFTPDIFKMFHSANFNPSLVKKTMLLKFLCASTKRNLAIADQVILAVKAGRKCLVVSERLQHLQDLETALYKQWGDITEKPSVGFYIGGQEQEALDSAAKCQVVFATNQLVSEGLDIPPLDTAFLTVPLGDVEQLAGRILRPHEGKKEPIIVDFRDDHVAICKRYGEYRDKFYAKQQWSTP